MRDMGGLMTVMTVATVDDSVSQRRIVVVLVISSGMDQIRRSPSMARDAVSLRS
jgi:hypothetical protein